ncbi:MAG: glycerophosphoryl diester phosphodiesterase membrane domain-containing protein, partial [Acidimicrobiales bacterium]
MSGSPSEYSPAKRMVVLKEMDIGELLDAAINLYRAHWRTYIGITAYVLGPFLLAESLALRTVAGPARLGRAPVSPQELVGGAFLLGILFSVGRYLFVQPFLIAATTRATADIYLGEKPTVGGIYGFAFSRTHSVLWVATLTGLAVMGGFLALIVPGVIFFARFAFGPPAVVVEGLRGRQAMKRSWAMAKGHFWKILGVLVLALILSGLISLVLQLPFVLLGALAGPAGWVVRGVGATLAGVIANPLG